MHSFSKARRLTRKPDLHRALLDILAFTYKIDLCDLTVALGWTKCLHPTRHGTSSLLTPEEHVRLLHISKVIEKSRKRLIRSRRSFLSQADITIINSIVAPARKLRLLPSYVCLLLELYCRHQMQPSKHRHTIRYFSKTRLWRWLGESEQRTLQERLVSDRHLVKQLLTHNENAASLYQKEIQVCTPLLTQEFNFLHHRVKYATC
ncbi:hypothetical protein BDV96DRAFT_31809 [Lophiotrema nucula]|uniref:Uncharacterized protein n=1 Tax=Lophiotrema nucula TaxID=690887 RepID=A0A6A5ZDW1_9PLEO|nr:hypothetical protein BDV96DRAFT_31809 [Lophiotrema nucula]